jgi:molybdate transport system ATP-binding protein
VRNTRHEIALQHRAGPLELDVHFTLDAPWTALFAPSGAGKTTILRMIAGLDHPHSGRIVCHSIRPPQPPSEFVSLDTHSHINVPPHHRAIRMVAQRPALFPHLSVLKNIVYRMPATTIDGEEIHSNNQHLEAVLELCRVTHLTRKTPSQLSGGERQRVALARTIAAGTGRLLLLDEPFTGLESDLRDDLIRDLKLWTAARSTPVLLVTHDIGEVFAAEAHVLKMESGRIAASGPAAEVLAAERDRLIHRLRG